VDERDDIQQKMNDAISSAVGSDDFVVKYVALVEVIDGDGDKAIWSVASEDITSWDVLGLLHYGITRENSISTLRVFGEAMEEDEEDE
jgi:hypothetical protein